MKLGLGLYPRLIALYPSYYKALGLCQDAIAEIRRAIDIHEAE